MSQATYLISDVFDGLASLPDNSVDLVLTSSPFLALRSYLPADHKLKGKEIGGESTPAEFLDTLLDVVEACDRVLAPHGSLVWELGDTYCADRETEILTGRGWLAWDQVTNEDDALTINPESRLAEWQPVKAVNVFPSIPRRMLSIEGRSMSALVTSDHRWFVSQRRGFRGQRHAEPQFRTSEHLNLESTVPTAAPVANLPTEPKYSDALVETIAWYWTEGHDRKPGAGRTQQTGIYIAQSHTVNPVNVARIRGCLTALFGPPSARLPGVKGAPPTWREDIWGSEDKTDFRLNAAAARVLREHAPNKVPQPEWLASLTQAQLDLFIERSIDADGQRTKRGIGLAQKEYARASMFQYACTLAGRSASLNPRQSKCLMWAVTINRNASRKPLRQASVEWIHHEGIVWCPTTANGTWLARRRGTTYFTGNSGSGGAGGDYAEGGLREHQPKFRQGTPRWDEGREGQVRATTWPEQEKIGDGTGRRQRAVDVEAGILPSQKRPGPEGRDRLAGWPLDKSLTGIPTLFTWSLAYGRNLLRPERETPQWRIRNLIVWCRPNPPVGALADKVRPATSYLTVACKSKSRWFDLDAVRTEHTEPIRHNVNRPKRQSENGVREEGGDNRGYVLSTGNPAGAPPLDYWVVPTQPYKGAHYATWPEKLITKPILAMCPERVCTSCGEPSRRISRPTDDYLAHRGGSGDFSRHNRGDADLEEGKAAKGNVSGFTAQYKTVGWTDCGHDSWRNGVVLDPFVGSGTTLAVSSGLGRDSVGIDLDQRNADLAYERVGMFLTVKDLRDE